MIPMFFDQDVKLEGLYSKRISMVDKSVYQSKNKNEIVKNHVMHISNDLKEEGYEPVEGKGYIKGNFVICEIIYIALVQ